MLTISFTSQRFDIGFPADGEDDLDTFTEDFDMVGIPAYAH